MKRLINTKLFLMLEKKDEVLDLSNENMKSIYDDFAQSVTSLCSLGKWNTLSYFTMHYTRLELEKLQTSFSPKSSKKKSANSKLYYSLSVVLICCSTIGDFF